MTHKTPMLRPGGTIATAFAALAGVAAATVAMTSAAMAADAAHPTVVELFQSQGCSSCPPANANVLALSSRPDLLTLSFQVTYWDQLGWKDTFAAPQYTARQWQYARGFRHDRVWTPQVIVNGRTNVVGTRRGEVEGAITRADRGVSGPTIEVSGARASVSGIAGAHRADVWLVRYDPNIVQVAIRAGENGGRTLSHRNVVRELIRLGEWSGHAQSYALPPAKDGFKVAILVQEGRGGPIVAAGRG